MVSACWCLAAESVAWVEKDRGPRERYFPVTGELGRQWLGTVAGPLSHLVRLDESRSPGEIPAAARIQRIKGHCGL